MSGRSLSLRHWVFVGLVFGVAGCGGRPEVIRERDRVSGAGKASIGTDGGGNFFFGRDGGSGGTGGTCAADACAAAPVCGDGNISGSEQCDDGNSIPGDGCSGVCQIEPGFVCPTPGAACVPSVPMVCGNSRIEGFEVCDDGNAKGGDGCSADCQAVEAGWTCGVAGQACVPTHLPQICGDGLLEAPEQCDDGDAADAASSNGDGCSSDCKREAGWTCPKPGSPCVLLQYCGDGIQQASLGETCDDGNAIPGDGCSGVCQGEPGYDCSAAGKPCVNIWVCGNGKVDPGETCDDHGTISGDGCTSNCTVEPGFSCPKAPDGTGGACVPVKNSCGDAIIAAGESCDDGGTTSGDGCDATCQVETGWTCPTPGAPCKKTAYCGNSVVDLVLSEECDDGNTKGGDGCSPLCKFETGYSCPTPGVPCVSTVKCPDGKIGGTEQCDDNNSVAGDGCDPSCQLEVGWICPEPGAHCVAQKCGDGIKVGGEQCDDGNGVDGDGCSAACRPELGYMCTTAAGKPSSCSKTVCPDGKTQGFEQCDDGNSIPYDGCSPACTIEPKCSGGQCTAVCGDGFKFPQEACDDGNLVDNDGCDSHCQIEKGFTCTVVTLAPPSQLVIPILYRDFRYRGTTNGHPDFQWNVSAATGLLQSNLAADGLPVFKSSQNLITDATSFYWWYHDTLAQTDADGGTSVVPNPYSKLVYLDAGGNPTTLTLPQIGSGAYQFSSTQFFPVDGLGWNADPSPQVDTADDGKLHNFAFTSELRYQFTYGGGEVLDFTGDDDVWVYINGKLAVDLGGVHGAENGGITLDATAATNLGLVKGSMYEIALFQAERHTTQSNYRLTLTGFVHALSQCTPICGDGVVTEAEVCDDGKNNGSYGSCLPGCQGRAPYCGDKTVQKPPEACDDGTNLGSYGKSQLCAPGCQFAPYCGDGRVSDGEACDEGATNGAGYGHCTALCTLGPRCGDGQKNGPEACDQGINNGSTASNCDSSCKIKCGNGTVDAGEQCDNGTAVNVGGYGKCNPNCTFAPRCGDGIKNGNETCDDGKNDGSYGTCTPLCGIAGYCGDGAVQNPPESCDLKAANSASAYGRDSCTNRCTVGPYCGDKAVDAVNGEGCDDGLNNGNAGSCTTDCKSYVPLSSCGDGTVETPEVCDDGTNNGTPASPCDAHCRKKCGNGFKDPGEQCDNGVNNGSYGTCNANCTLAGYCGDNAINGSEQCDNGSRNVDVGGYGQGLCTKACTKAAYCGDGRIQSQFEQCDGGPGCTSICSLYGPH